MELRDGLSGSGAVEVVDVPEFDAIYDGWEELLEQRAVLRFFDGNDEMAGLKVVLDCPNRIARWFGRHDAQFLRGLQCMTRDRPNVVRVGIEAARVGSPGEGTLSGQMVKQQ